MSRLHHLPAHSEFATAADRDRCLVRSRIEILFILRAIMRRNALVSLYFDQGNNCVPTSILDIDADRGTMVLDLGANQDFNRRALTARELVFVTSHDQVKVQFVCHDTRKTGFAGHGAFRVKIPESLLRMQRRAYYRLRTPAVNPLKCTIPLPGGPAEVVLLDISCGGIGLIDHHPKVSFEPGTLHENCSIVLPGIGTINAAIRVKITCEATLKNGLTCRRAGCEFVAMPEAMVVMIQRYILKLEREEKRRRTGLG